MNRRDVEISRARARAARLYRSEGFRGAYVRGARAALQGVPAEACPYRRRVGGGWQAWRRSWMLGYRSIAT